MIIGKKFVLGACALACISGQVSAQQAETQRGGAAPSDQRMEDILRGTSERAAGRRDMNEPAANAPAGEQNDRTAQNEPMDQQRTDLIARVRSDVVADDSLSTMAHNVAILSEGPSSVILRGRVRNNAEKQKLVQIARRHAGQVTDETTIDRG